MKIEIKNRFNGPVLFSLETDSIKLALEAAIKSGANLGGAYLMSANLGGAYLSGANVASVCWPAPTMVLLANWDRIGDALTLDLMRYDADNHPDPKSFLRWAKTGECPFSKINIQRSANFLENPKLIKPSFLRRKPKSAYQLMQALLKECCKTD